MLALVLKALPLITASSGLILSCMVSYFTVSDLHFLEAELEAKVKRIAQVEVLKT